MERTLVLIKPDAVKKKLIGKIISIYEDNGLSILDSYMCVPTAEVLAKHYSEHIDRDFYPSLIEFMTSSNVVVLLIGGQNAINVVRDINGSTNPAKARPCSIRYLYGDSVQINSVHGSANPEEAEKEIAIWFKETTF